MTNVICCVAVSGNLKIALTVLLILTPLAMLAAAPVIFIRLRRRWRLRQMIAKQRQRYYNDIKDTEEFHRDPCNVSDDVLKEMRRTTVSPPKRLSTPGFIAVFSPSKQGYSVYDEFDSSRRPDDREMCDMNVDSPLRHKRTSPLNVQMRETSLSVSQSPSPVRGHTRQPLSRQNSVVQTSLDEPVTAAANGQLNSSSSSRLYKRLHKQGSVSSNNIYTTAPKANPNSVSVIV